MKKIIALSTIICLVFTSIVNAQDNDENKNQRKETFDYNTFDWEEVSEKNQSAIIADGYLTLTNKKKDEAVRITTTYPVKVKRNFTITNTFLIPELNDKNRFGIIFNYADNDNYSSFLIAEGHFWYYTKKEGKMKLEKDGKMKLKGGKNKTVTITIQKQGSELNFRVDDMPVYTVKKNLAFPNFGFYSEGPKTTIMVDEIVIDQYQEE